MNTTTTTTWTIPRSSLPEIVVDVTQYGPSMMLSMLRVALLEGHVQTLAASYMMIGIVLSLFHNRSQVPHQNRHL